METVLFKIPVKDIPVFKGAAKELCIDFIIEPFNQGDEWVNAHALVGDLTSLVSLGYVAGINAMYVGIKKPMNELEDKLRTGINNIINKTDIK